MPRGSLFAEEVQVVEIRNRCLLSLVLALYILSYHLQTMLVMPVTTGNVGFKSRLVVHIRNVKKKGVGSNLYTSEGT